jgi:hypothetical protein
MKLMSLKPKSKLRLRRSTLKKRMVWLKSPKKRLPLNPREPRKPSPSKRRPMKMPMKSRNKPLKNPLITLKRRNNFFNNNKS